MKINEFDINHADGKILINDIRLDTGVLERGHRLTKEDILYLKMMGIKRITAAEIGVSDIVAENALSNLAPRLCGKNAEYVTPARNLCKIAAAKDGIFICQENRIAKFNRMSSKVVLNTIAPYQNVKKNDIIATLTVIPPFLEEDVIEDMDFKLSGNEPLLSVEETQVEHAAVIYTKFYDDEQENAHFSAVVRKMIANYAPLGLEFDAEYYCPHTVDGIADAVAHAAGRHNMVMLLSAMPTTHPKDTVPQALDSIVGTVVCDHIPQTDMADLLIAVKRNTKIINIPYNYATAESYLADLFVRIAVKKDRITQTDFAFKKNVFTDKKALSEQEIAGIVAPQKKNKKDPTIAAVILAAGISSRARRNKLMVKVDGKPLFLKAVEAAVRSKASPVFVVTGYEAEDIEEHLENIDINILRNHDYASGVKTSIRLGLKSVPSSCDGALLIPADMPNITAEYLDKMIKSFDKKKERQLVVSTHSGHRCNPVLWSSELYPLADLAPEDTHLRQVFLEHSDYIKMVEASPDICFDVNFPNDLEILTKNNGE